MRLPIQVILYNSTSELEKLLISYTCADKTSMFDPYFHFVIHDESDVALVDRKIKEYLKSHCYSVDKNNNIGFGGGHNWIYERQKYGYSEYFMVLNPDTLFFPDFFVKLESRLGKSGDNLGIADMRQFPQEHPKKYDFKSLDTNWASGSAMLVNTEAFETVGGFDEAFFMYFEDVDLSWRIKAKGWSVKYFADCRIVHSVGASTVKNGKIEQSDFANVHNLAGELYITEKFRLENKDRVYWIREESIYRRDVVKRYEEMRENIVRFPRKRCMSIEQVRNSRW